MRPRHDRGHRHTESAQAAGQRIYPPAGADGRGLRCHARSQRLAVLLATGADLGRLEWFAQLYSVFFAVYLTALQLGGVLPSVIAGNASIMVMVATRHAVRSTTLTRVSLVVVLVGGVAMTAARDDHGAGILIGVTLACLVLARRRECLPSLLRTRPP